MIHKCNRKSTIVHVSFTLFQRIEPLQRAFWQRKSSQNPKRSMATKVELDQKGIMRVGCRPAPDGDHHNVICHKNKTYCGVYIIGGWWQIQWQASTATWDIVVIVVSRLAMKSSSNASKWWWWRLRWICNIKCCKLSETWAILIWGPFPQKSWTNFHKRI